MITTNEELLHIQEVMDDHGYVDCGKLIDASRWYVSFEYSYDNIRIYRKVFMCQDESAALRAVRSLLRRTRVYCVLVHSPVCKSVVSYYGTKTLVREWSYYYHNNRPARDWMKGCLS